MLDDVVSSFVNSVLPQDVVVQAQPFGNRFAKTESELMASRSDLHFALCANDCMRVQSIRDATESVSIL